MLIGPPARIADAATTIYVRPDGNNTHCNGTTNDPYPGSGGPGLNCAVKTVARGVALVDAGGTVNVAAGVYTESENPYTQGSIIVNKSMTITGAGAATTKVQAGDIPYFGVNRVFDVSGGITVAIERLTIRNGDAPASSGDHSGGGIRSAAALTVRDCIIFSNQAQTGAGIAVTGGSLTLYNTEVYGNSANWRGGGIALSLGTVADFFDSHVEGNTAMGMGGGFYTQKAQLYLHASAVTGNWAGNGGGGIWTEDGTTTLNNSTVSRNYTPVSGGGIYTWGKSSPGAQLHLNYSTVTDNAANISNGGYQGGGILAGYEPGVTSEVTYKSSIIAGNRLSDWDCAGAPVSVGDCGGSGFISQGYNMLGASCPVNGSDQTTTDAKLGLLALNGGGAWTHAPLDGSPALDLIPNGVNGCGTDFTADGRGKPRPADAGGGVKCDAGAHERQHGELISQNSSLPQGVPFDFNTLSPGVNVKVTRNTSDNPGSVTALKRGVYPGLSQNAGELPVVWTVSASCYTYNLDLTLCYNDDELGGVNESTLRAYRWNEDARRWEDKGGTVDADANCVTVAGVTALSPWTLSGDGQAPTAVVLRAFRGQEAGALTVGLAGVAIGVAGLLLWRRRRRTG
jgi:hypothetical protein